MTNRVYPDHETRHVADLIQRAQEAVHANASAMPTALIRVCIIRLRQISQDLEMELLHRTEELPRRQP